MTPEQHKSFVLFERGIITVRDLVGRLVDVTVESPSAEMVARLPPGALEIMRELAKLPRGTPAGLADYFEGTHSAPPVVAEEYSGPYWLDGLVYWRPYFEANG